MAEYRFIPHKGICPPVVENIRVEMRRDDEDGRLNFIIDGLPVFCITDDGILKRYWMGTAPESIKRADFGTRIDVRDVE